MTKEPNKYFMERLIELLIDEGLDDFPYRRISTSVIELCKEMLVPEEKDTSIRHYCTTISFKEGWNACRAELLKQLGEK